ncbi:MAG TPA: glycosyltransferase family 87 protein [Terriglobales bacterium]|jgi:Glycosyltransferase family 87|nr:glycosyltransferase family 87 protein [Terriglobales bacterium]
MKILAKATLALTLATLFLLFLASSFRAILGGIDFPDFYCAGVLAREHLDIYDASAQQHCQMRESGRAGTYYIHPPFETLLFVPLARLPLKQAYLAWNSLSLVLLAVSIRSLLRGWNSRGDWLLITPLTLLFPPLLLNFVQGQDSVLLMAVCVFALEALERRSFLQAGALLGLGLFKFHIVLPLALLCLIRGKLRFAVGFLASTSVLIGISLASFGWNIFEQYARFLREWPELPNSGMHWQAMANIRGLIALITTPENRFVTASLLIATVILLGVGAWSWRTAGHSVSLQMIAFSTSVVIALLVSYHLSPHDLTLLLIPMASLIENDFKSKRLRWAAIALVTVVFLPPIHLIVLHAKYYAWMVVPILLIFSVLVLMLASSHSNGANLAKSPS